MHAGGGAGGDDGQNARHTPIRAVSVTLITIDKVGKATAYLLTAIWTVVGVMPRGRAARKVPRRTNSRTPPHSTCTLYHHTSTRTVVHTLLGTTMNSTVLHRTCTVVLYQRTISRKFVVPTYRYSTYRYELTVNSAIIKMAGQREWAAISTGLYNEVVLSMQ